MKGLRGVARNLGRLLELNVRFSHRPVWVKRLQATHHYSVDVAHGLVLLFGIGADGRPQEFHDCHQNEGLFLRSTQSLATCNENTNGVLRQYFPNGSLAFLSAYLNKIALRLNQRARQTLGFVLPIDYERSCSDRLNPPSLADIPPVSQRFSSLTCEMPTRRNFLPARNQALMLAELFTSLLA